MKRIGPELKMPNFKSGEMKVPPFLSDLYGDLRDRRLLPVIGLILVAIVATPFLLGGNDEAEVAPAPGVAPTTGSVPSADTLTVVKAEPGLRNYKKRLSHRSPTNPFKQRFSGPTGLKEAQLNEKAPSESTSSSSEGPSSVEVQPAPTLPVPAPAAGGSGSSPGSETAGGVPGGATLYTLEVTLQITRIETKPDGTVDKQGPTVYKDVQAPAPLPGEKTPVITYLGMGSKGKVPMFLVSNEVTGIFGEAQCISGAKTCQLLVLEEGFPVTFVYGENDVRYKVNLLKAKPVVTGHS